MREAAPPDVLWAFEEDSKDPAIWHSKLGNPVLEFNNQQEAGVFLETEASRLTIVGYHTAARR